ncbi:unnamed protein product [Coregonus sp. 'balchen']|nr:unnamed protein product [Coregonus sp. 'balchen']
MVAKLDPWWPTGSMVADWIHGGRLDPWWPTGSMVADWIHGGRLDQWWPTGSMVANLPLLQRELLHCARLAKQNPAQYLAKHEQLLLDTSSTTSPTSTTTARGEHLAVREPVRSARQANGSAPPTVPLPYQPNGLAHGHPTPPPQHYRLDDMAITHHYRDSPHYRHPNHNHRELRERPRPLGMHGARQEEVIDHRLTDREWAEEWKHLDHVNKIRPYPSRCERRTYPPLSAEDTAPPLLMLNKRTTPSRMPELTAPTPSSAAELIQHLPPPHDTAPTPSPAAELIQHLPPSSAAELIQHLPPPQLLN